LPGIIRRLLAFCHDRNEGNCRAERTAIAIYHYRVYRPVGRSNARDFLSVLGEEHLAKAVNQPRQDNRNGNSSKKRGGDMQNVTVSQQMTFIEPFPPLRRQCMVSGSVEAETAPG